MQNSVFPGVGEKPEPGARLPAAGTGLFRRLRVFSPRPGFIVNIADNGLVTIAMALDHEYDLVFMDKKMPLMDGLTAAARPASVPVIAMNRAAPQGGMKTPQEFLVSDLPSSLPGIDVASGIARVANNKALYLKLLRHVAADAPNIVEKLTSAIMAGDATQAREVAHSIKGSAGNLSMLTVQAAAEKVEMAAKAENFSELAMHAAELEKALDDFAAVIRGIEG